MVLYVKIGNHSLTFFLFPPGVVTDSSAMFCAYHCTGKGWSSSLMTETSLKMQTCYNRGHRNVFNCFNMQYCCGVEISSGPPSHLSHESPNSLFQLLEVHCVKMGMGIRHTGMIVRLRYSMYFGNTICLKLVSFGKTPTCSTWPSSD